VAFYSRKIIVAECNYEIYNVKLLAIIEIFKYWKYYFKDSFYLIQVWINYANLRYFITIK
jgi:hypothetical protein